MTRHLLVALADKNCIDQAKQLFSSVYFNAGWKGDYMLMSYNIPEKELTWFKNKGILIYKCKPIHNGKESGIEYLPLEDTMHKDLMREIKRFREAPVILNKFEMFTPYFKKWDTVLYLDCDIIVRYSLDKLTKVKGFCALLERPQQNGTLRSQFYRDNYNEKTFKKLENEFDLKAKDFNSGVMAFSTDIIKDDTFQKLIELFKQYHQVYAYPEQAILNLYFYKKWKKINFMYNLWVPMWKYYFVFKAPENIDAIVIHTLGPEKAWLPKSPFYKEWRNNLLKADQIDLKNRAIFSDRFSNIKMLSYSSSLYFNSLKIRFLSFATYQTIDTYIGRCGIILRKHSPRIYFILKKYV